LVTTDIPFFFGRILAVFILTIGIKGYHQTDEIISLFQGDTTAIKRPIWMASGRNIARAVVVAFPFFKEIALFINEYNR